MTILLLTADVIRFDDRPFPAGASISLRCASGRRLSHTVRVDDVPQALDDVRTGWDRRPRTATPPAPITDPLLRAHIDGEASFFMDDVWDTLECAWLPARRSVIRRAEQKALQLQAASALGFDIPPTVITNDPRELMDFYREHEGAIVSKSFMHPRG